MPELDNSFLLGIMSGELTTEMIDRAQRQYQIQYLKQERIMLLVLSATKLGMTIILFGCISKLSLLSFIIIFFFCLCLIAASILFFYKSLRLKQEFHDLIIEDVMKS